MLNRYYGQLESISTPYPYVVWSVLVLRSNRVSKCAEESHMFFGLAGFSGIDKFDEEKLHIWKLVMRSINSVLYTSLQHM